MFGSEEEGDLRQHLAAPGRQERADVLPEARSRQAGEDVRAGDHIDEDADRLLELQATQQGQEVGAEVGGGGPGRQVQQRIGQIDSYLTSKVWSGPVG